MKVELVPKNGVYYVLSKTYYGVKVHYKGTDLAKTEDEDHKYSRDTNDGKIIVLEVAE
jgi:hypothetical protein